ncbi:hypothetical protein BGZ76_002158 [Entomortierella beljakovae]|nr:hypothetical protein BGZ76_002158 [Entomortierella beljakovae]
MSAPKPKPKLSYKAQSFPSSDKPFECTACQLYFRRLHDLKRHERLHTGERPYCCNNCRRTFARLDALKRHLSAESNVHCSDWTYQPGLISGLNRPAIRSHQRSISLPYVQNSSSRVSPHDLSESIERKSNTPSPKENLSFQQHYQTYQHHPHHQLQSSPEAQIMERNKGNDSIMQERSPYPPRSSTDPEYHCRQERHYWGTQSRESPTKLGGDRTLLSDITMEEDTSQDHSKSRAGPVEPLQLSPPSYPQHHNYFQSLSHSYSHPDPNVQQSFQSFSRDQLRQRHESYPSSPSRSTLSPSPSPILSPSPSSMSASSMSSPTNIWPFVKGDGLETAGYKRNSQSYQESWSQPRLDSFPFPQRSSRQDPSTHNEDAINYDRHRLREFDRRPGPSLASILSSPQPSSNQTSTPPPPPLSSSSAASASASLPRSMYPHHSHSHSYSHPQQQFHHHHHHHSSQQPNEGEHCCEAMVEIQKLRQELQWVTMRYRNLSEKTISENTSTTINNLDGSSSSSNNLIPKAQTY